VGELLSLMNLNKYSVVLYWATVRTIKRVGHFPPTPDKMRTTQIQMEVATVFKLK